LETAVILVSYINKLRNEGLDIRTATRQASLLRLRPIMMTALVACLGLLPAGLSTGIGSDTQKPFAIVIVARADLPPVYRFRQPRALRDGRP
jgi:cobalt-zinc-cadmium resistance protein CzcA